MILVKLFSFFCGPKQGQCSGRATRGTLPLLCAALLLSVAGLFLSGCGVSPGPGESVAAATKSTPALTWANPASITFGTALGAQQLNATSTVAGTFTYSPAAGTVPPTGTDTLTVNFTPSNTSAYTTASKSVSLVVDASGTVKSTPTITWPTPSAITYGTALSSKQLDATSSVAGSFSYSPGPGTVPSVGTEKLTVTFTPFDVADYNTATASVSLSVEQPVTAKNVPRISWSTPAPISYGTALSSKQLDATASVPGTFAYSPAAGTVPAAGTDNLTVTFTPTDTVDYETVTKSVSLVVNKSTAKTTPTIYWPAPTPITYGTALSSSQLDATASVAGTFSYSPAAGTVLAAGIDTLSVTFTPSDTTDYNSATATVSLSVVQKSSSKTTPTITWPTPAAITYGTALSSKQLDAIANVAGTFSYSPAAGAVLPVGTDTLIATFTPSNTAKYNVATATVSLVVNKATTTKSTPIITWPTPAAITYGTALSSKQLDATANVAGTFVYSPAAGTVPAAGTDTLTVAFTPTDTTDYNTATASVSLVVNKGTTTTKSTPTITWPTPAAITYGTALSSKQLDATANVAGTFVYSPAAGTVPAAGTDTLTVTFTPTDTTDYNTATASVSLVVNSGSSSASGTALSSCADLTKSGTYYLSQDVSSSETCFFIDADNITLNLNGHTITYDTAGTAGAPGILLADTWYTAPGYTLARTGSTDSHAGFVLYGGTITEASNGGIQSRGIWVGQSSDISPAPVIHDVVINTSTQDAAPIFGTVSDSGWQIYNTTVNWACKSTYPATGTPCDSNRDDLYGYGIWIADDPDSPGAVPDQIYNNKITNAPQGGVFDNHQNAKITGNDITFDSYFTNDYCVATVSGDGQVISGNNCHPTSGRGIDVEAANVQVTDNTISVTELPQNAEYGGCEGGGADGIRIRDNLSQGNPSAPTNVTLSGNIVTAAATQCQANGLQLTNLDSGDNATISGNTLTISGTGSQLAYGISLDETDQPPLSFSGNTISSAYAQVGVEWDGANTIIDGTQTWSGSPKYFVDNENGSLQGGTTFSQSLTVDSGSGTVHCGVAAGGPVIVSGTAVTCN